jgi:exopolysaccharide production protein ExoZ
MIMPPAAPQTQIAAVQVLRALAALVVVIGHAQHEALVEAGKRAMSFAASHALPWNAGVDLFFVISGFIMVYASQKLFGAQGAAATFLRRRIIRIVPLYWLVAGAYLALALVASGRAPGFDASALSLLASFLFLPFDTYRDGMPRPFYTLGWTLNYEMFFYAVFAGCLLLRRTQAILATAALLGAGVVLGALVPLALPLSVWTQAIVLEFVLGMALAEAYLRGLRLPQPATWGLAALAIALLAYDPLGSAHQPTGWIVKNDALRLLGWGVPCALLFAAFVLRPQNPAPAGPLTRFGVALGDASYALYLTHPFVIVAGRKLYLAAGLEAHLGFWPMVAGLILLSVLAAFLVYEIIEKPVTAWLQRRTAAQPSVASAGNASSR